MKHAYFLLLILGTPLGTQAAEKQKTVSELVKQFGGAKPTPQPKKSEPKIIAPQEPRVIATPKGQAITPAQKSDEKRRAAAQAKMKSLLEQQYAGVIQELTSHPLFTKKQAPATTASKPQPAPVKPVQRPPEIAQERTVDTEAKRAQAPMHKFKSLKELQAFYNKEMQDQEKLLMEIFYDLTGVSKQEFDKTLALEKDVVAAESKEYLQKFKMQSTLIHGLNHILPIGARPTKEQELFAKDTMATAKKIFRQEHIALPELFFNYLPEGGLINVWPTHMKVEMHSCERMPAIQIETGLFHEMTHIRYNDFILDYTIKRLLTKYNPDSLQSFMQLWNFFTEKRADIFAWTRGIQYAKAGIDTYSSHRSHCHYEEYQTHQSDANRAASARQIYQEMLAIPNPR